MKKKHLLTFALSITALASCATVPASSTTPVDSSEPASVESAASSEAPSVPTTSDSIPSASPGESTEPTSSAVPIEGVFSGIVRLYFHNDTATEKSFRPYVWCDGVDGSEFDWTGYDNSIGAYYDIDITKAPYVGHVTDHISFIIKKPGTWAGQSVDMIAYFADFVDKATTHEATGLPMIQVYTCPGEGNAIDMSDDKSDVLGDSFSSFSANTDWKGFTLTGTGKVASYTLYAFDEVYMKYNDNQKLTHQDEYIILTGEPNTATVKLDISSSAAYKKMRSDGLVDPQLTYRVSAKFASNPNKTKKKIATFDKLYDTATFKSKYTYSGNDLGVHYKGDKTEFRIWTPVSTAVRVNIYDTGTPAAYTDDPVAHMFDDYPFTSAWLTKQNGGVFSGTIDMDLDGYYYTFSLFYNETSYEIVDPYAFACGVNGLRGAIVDFSKTNPEGWDTLTFPTISNPNNLTAYEVHVRDFTADKTWVSNKDNPAGTYPAFAETGTTYNGVKTGIDHIKELGVNAVQLLPVFDQDNDERTYETVVNGVKTVTKPGYNWGYNPANYNCVEGSYSSDPYDAATRIKEFKSLIYTLGKAGIRTIMDVVYNHVSSVTKHSFSTACPRYFFRYDKDMNLIDDTGCSNAVHTERVMASKFIVDSLKWWSSEYKIKGFRFDLMGCIDTTTMRNAKDAVYDMGAAYRDVVMYGEGWSGSMSGAHMLLGGTPSTSGNVYSKLKPTSKGGVGCFNDAGRDGAKGNDGEDKAPEIPGVNSNATNKCWLTKEGNMDNVYNTLTMVLGENRWNNGAGCDPNQTVNYLACHDNYTLYDQLNYQFEYYGQKNYASGTNEWVMKAATDLTAFTLFAQGIGFIHGGDEFFRQKVMHADDENLKAMQESYHKGSYYHEDTGVTDYWQEGDGVPINAAKTEWLVRNSYKYGDAVNSFKWDRLTDKTVAKYYGKIKEAVALRTTEMGNCLGQTKAKVDAGNTWCWDNKDLIGEDGKQIGSILAAGFIGQKDSKGVYMFMNKAVDDAQIGIGNGAFQVLYSSTGTHSGNFTISDNKTPKLAQYECLIVRRTSGTIK